MGVSVLGEGKDVRCMVDLGKSMCTPAASLADMHVLLTWLHTYYM
jgi:hypothetical protein